MLRINAAASNAHLAAPLFWLRCLKPEVGDAAERAGEANSMMLVVTQSSTVWDGIPIAVVVTNEVESEVSDHGQIFGSVLRAGLIGILAVWPA